MAVEVGQGEQEKALIRHVCLYWRHCFYWRCLCFIRMSKTDNTGPLFLLVQTLKSLFSLLVWYSLSVLLHEMSLTCAHCCSFCLSVFPLAWITLCQFSNIVGWEREAVLSKQNFEERDPFCVGPALAGCIQSMPGEYLKGDIEKTVSFLESFLVLRTHDNRSMVMQTSAKIKALPGPCWRGMLGAWEASVLKAVVSRNDTFLLRK